MNKSIDLNSYASFVEYLASSVKTYLTKSKRAIIGVVGPSGSCKTHLSNHIVSVLQKKLKKKVLRVCIDDFYLSAEEQEAKGIEVLGLPGSHDLGELSKFFDAFVKGLPEIEVRRYDESLVDDDNDGTYTFVTDTPDIIILEGWFVGLRSMPNMDTEANRYLRDYTKFWDSINFQIILKPTSAEYTYEWLKEAENEELKSPLAKKNSRTNSLIRDSSRSRSRNKSLNTSGFEFDSDLNKSGLSGRKSLNNSFVIETTEHGTYLQNFYKALDINFYYPYLIKNRPKLPVYRMYELLIDRRHNAIGITQH